MGFRGVPTLGPAERSVVVGTSRSSWHSPTTCGSSSRRRRIRGVLLEEEAEPTGPSVGATASWDPASQMVPANVPDSPLGTVSAVLSATSAEQSAGDSTLPSVRRCFRTTWVTRLAGCGTRGNMKAGLSSWGRSRLANRHERDVRRGWHASPRALPAALCVTPGLCVRGSAGSGKEIWLLADVPPTALEQPEGEASVQRE